MASRYDYFINLQLLNDDAKDQAGPFDPCKTRGLIDRLVGILERRTTKPYPCVGLFGPFGQGKTSLLKSLEVRIGTLAKDGGLSAPRVQWFDAAHYKPDELEHEFDHLVMRWRFRALFWMIFSGIASGAVLLWMANFLIASWESDPLQKLETIWSRTTTGAWHAVSWLLGLGALAAIWKIVLGWTPLKFLLRDIQRSSSLSGWEDVKWISLGIPPDILIIDNLDRAAVAQQRAVLRAIGKHRDKLAVPIVVAMDESALLAGPADPEAPAELLRKVIDAELRMPLITPGDGAILVAAIAGEALVTLGAPATTSLLSSPRTLGDIARIVQLTGIATPRRLKRLLNDAFQQAAVMGAYEPGDFGAILRLRALIELVPTLAAVPERIIPVMVYDDEESFAKLLSDYGVVNPAPAIALMRATRHLRPARGSWRVFIEQLSGNDGTVLADAKPPDVQNREILQTSPDGLRKMVSDLEYNLAAIARGVQGEDWKATVRACEHPADKETLGIVAWLTVETKLARMTDPVGRLRILQSLASDPNSFTIGSEDTTEAMFRIDRLWLADHQILAVMNQKSRERLFYRCFCERTQLLTLVPAFYLTFLDRLTIACYIDTRLNLETIGIWVGAELTVESAASSILFAMDREIARGGVEYTEYEKFIAIRPRSILPDPIWPRLGGEEFGAEPDQARRVLAWHLSAFRAGRNLGLIVEPRVLQAAFHTEGFLDRWFEDPVGFLDILDRELFGGAADDGALEVLFVRQSETFARLVLEAHQMGVAWSAPRIWRVLPFLAGRAAGSLSLEAAGARDVLLDRLERVPNRGAVTVERFQALDRADSALLARRTPDSALAIIGESADQPEIAKRLVQVFLENEGLPTILVRTISQDPLPLRAVEAEDPIAASDYLIILRALSRCDAKTRSAAAALLAQRAARTREEALIYLDGAIDLLEAKICNQHFESLSAVPARLQKRLSAAKRKKLAGIKLVVAASSVITEPIPDFSAFLQIAADDPKRAYYEIASATTDLPSMHAERRDELERRLGLLRAALGIDEHKDESPDSISMMDAIVRRFFFSTAIQQR